MDPQRDARPQTSPRWFLAFFVLLALGATLGTALDGIHTHFGATVYSHPLRFFRMAWWTPPVFGLAFTIGLARPLLDVALKRRTGVQKPPPRLLAVLNSLALFVVAYFTTVLPLPWPLVSLLLLLLYAVNFGLFDRSAIGLFIAVCAAFGGPLVEFLLVEAGTFVHVHPVFLDVSGWLPFLYLNSAVPLTLIARFLVRAEATSAA
jgi:hypothetical protein